MEDPRWHGIGLAWLMAAVMHLLTFDWLVPPAWGGVIYLAATLFLLMNPGSFIRILVLVLTTFSVFLLNYPDLSNHLVLEFWFLGSVLSIGAWRLVRRRPVSVSDCFDLCVPIARLHYILLYLFSFIAKLNADFLSPETSCAARFLKEIGRAYHLNGFSFVGGVFESGMAGHCAIWLTLGFEILIPCLLCFGRTRRVGIGVAICFHLLMGFVPILGISSFSALSVVFLLFFYSSDSLCHFGKNLPRISSLKKGVLGLVVVGGLWIQFYGFHLSYEFATSVWALMTIPLVYWMFKSLVRGSRMKMPTRSRMAISPMIQACSSIPIIALGMFPYLGIQTQGSFTMFSNLRVLGEQSNHLFISSSWRVMNPELIQIVNTNHSELEKYPGSLLRITDHELRRVIGEDERDFFLICEYKGEMLWLQRSEGIATAHPLTEPLPRISGHFLRYKDVSVAAHNTCSW
ncbi:MAG: hypothetical protein ACPGN3_02945 [Opitutales bacterium]